MIRQFIVGAGLLFPVLAIAAPIPAKLLAQHPRHNEITLSPDGRHLAITTPVDNRTDLIILDVKGKNEPVRLRYAPDEHIIDPVWVTDDRLVVNKGRKLGYLEQPFAIGELNAVRSNLTEPRILFGYQSDQITRSGRRKDEGFARVMDRLDARSGNVLVEFQTWNPRSKVTYVYRVDTATGSRKLVDSVDLYRASVSVDRAGVARFAVSLDDTGEPVSLYRPRPDSEWQPVPKSLAGRSIWVLAYGADHNMAWAEISDKGEPESLYRIDIAAGTREKVAGGGDHRVGFVVYAGFAEEPFAIISRSPKPSVSYFDAESPWARLHAGLMKRFAGNIVYFRDFSRDEQRVLFEVHGDRNPGQYYLLDRSDNSLSLVSERYEGLAAESLSPMRPVEFATPDGVILHGFLTTPVGAEGPFPMVVLPHGGPFGVEDKWGFDPDVQFLASRGYAVLQVNFRGSGGRGEAFEVSGYKEWGGKLMDDIAAGTYWAVANKVADPKRICTYGASFGGYAAMMQVIRFPDLYRCAIGFAGVYDLELMHKIGDIDDSKYGRHYLKTAVGDDSTLLASQSPARLVDRIKVPVLLIHGKVDRRVPVAHLEQLEEALEAAGKPVQTLVKNAEGHGFYKEENRVEEYEVIAAFLDRHIGPRN